MTALDVDQSLPGMPEPQTLVPAALDPRIPHLDSFEVHYGIPVSSIGDDGDMIALGHHDPKQTLAALNAYAKSLGLVDLLDGDGRWTDAWKLALDRVFPRWAVLLKHCDEYPRCAVDLTDDGNCQRRAEITQSGWCIDYGATEPGQDTFPVMIWVA